MAKQTYTCNFCGSAFQRCVSRQRVNQRMFCSKACHIEGQRKHGLNAAGYRIIRVNGRQVYEHRHMMEQCLGRKLERHEHVHHRNGVKNDNRLENLELMTASDHHVTHVPATFDLDEAKRLYDSGVGYRKLSKLFGVPRYSIQNRFRSRGWHVAGRTRTHTTAIAKKAA